MEGNNTMTRIEFLREQTVSAANKCARTPMPPMDVSEEPLSLPERKALGLKKIFETMPVYIGKRERIVGTRTYFTPTEGNADGHDVFGYTLFAGAKYVNDDDIARFGRNQSYINRTHYTPDFGIVLSRGIDGILADARARLGDAGLMAHQREFLSSVVIAWEGLKTLILRYADEAERLSCAADDATDRQELSDIAAVCRAVSGGVPKTFHEAVQLLWFAHLGIIVESFEFINYGRLDVLLGQFLFDTPKEEVTQLLACLLLKMYDQADLNIVSYRRKDKKGHELIVVLNFSPVVREGYTLLVPKMGRYEEILTTDRYEFGGRNRLNEDAVRTIAVTDENGSRKNMISITLPAMGGVILKKQLN